MMQTFVKLSCLAFFLLPLLVQADYLNLVGIPHYNAKADPSTERYVEALYLLAIGIAAMLAVARLIFAGAKYILTDVVTKKGDAKRDIQNVLVGLLLVLSAVLILNTINPQLTQLDALSNIEKVQVRTQTPLQSARPTHGCLTVNQNGSGECTQANCNGTWEQLSNGNWGCKGEIKEADGFDSDNIDINGTVVVISSPADRDAYIAEASDAGREVIFQTGAYNKTDSSVRRNNHIKECQDQGGSDYRVFESNNNDTELFICTG